jgi:DNA polymerase III alpha subunit
MHGAYKLYKDAKKHGLKYIPAIDIDVQMDNNERGNFIIIAKNEEGFNFIKKTVSLSFLKNHELFVDYDALL